MPRPLLLTEDHVRRFAGGSGDSNPLHVDERYARATPYGRCIAHGSLVTIAALAGIEPSLLAHVQEIDLQFKQPVLTGIEYAIAETRDGPDATRVEVERGGRPVLAVAVTADRAASTLPAVSKREPLPAASSPREYSIDELAAAHISVTEPYAARLDELRALAEDLSAEAVPDAVLSWLAGASYTVGMLIPGRDALFARARIVRSAADASGMLTAAVTAADDRTGFVTVEATLGDDDASAQMTLHAFARSPAPVPDRASVGRFLPASTDLAGREILVVGGSRGLGAAVCGAFATQAANVWAGFARSEEHAARLRSEFGAERVRLLQFDAEDAADSRRAFATLRSEVSGLDGVVLCAAPPVHETAVHPDESDAALGYVSSSLAMALFPLAEALQLLKRGGWVAVTSSSALDEPPESWPHYVVAKAALEGAAAYCARHIDARVLVVRPPKMWTDSTNTPMGRIGATPSELVAAQIVRWALGEEGEATRSPSLLTAEQLLAAPELGAT